MNVLNSFAGSLIQRAEKIIARNDVRKLPTKPPGSTKLFGGLQFIDGESLKAQYDEIVVREIFRFNPDVTNPIIIDLGSNIGLAIRWWKYFWPEAEVHGYEPSHEAFQALVENTKKLTKTKVFNKAIASSQGKVRLYAFGADASRITAPIDVGQAYDEVDAVTLSSILEEFTTIDLLKIDIEGAELDVLREATGALNKVKNLFVEFHSFDLGPNLGELLNLLSSQGFLAYPEARERQHKPFLSIPNDRGISYTVNIWAWREK